MIRTHSKAEKEYLKNFKRIVLSCEYIYNWKDNYVELSKQENWSGLPFPSPGDLPDPGVEPVSPEFLALTG